MVSSGEGVTERVPLEPALVPASAPNGLFRIAVHPDWRLSVISGSELVVYSRVEPRD